MNGKAVKVFNVGDLADITLVVATGGQLLVHSTFHLPSVLVHNLPG